MLYDAGVDVKSAQRFMGHADIETTLKIDTRISEQIEQQSADALNAHLGKQGGSVLALKNSNAAKNAVNDDFNSLKNNEIYL